MSRGRTNVGFVPVLVFVMMMMMMNTMTMTRGGCLTSVDCSMNGECTRSTVRPRKRRQLLTRQRRQRQRQNSSSQDNNNDDDEMYSIPDPQIEGSCVCFHGWKGEECDQFDFLPVPIQQLGLKLPGNVSTWGGSVIERDGQWHMFASRMVNGCGLYTWTTNSQVIRAVSSNGSLGPYEFQEVIVDVFAHEPNAMEAPTGEIVLYVTARRGVIPQQNCTHLLSRAAMTPRILTSSSSSRTSLVGGGGDNDNVPPKDTWMLWAPHPSGPWSEPVLVLNSTIWNMDYWNKTGKFAVCDSNLNGIIHPDGSFLGLWRRCETPNLNTIPHRITASNWRDPSTYRPHLAPLFVLGGSGAEDPSNIWTTDTSDQGMAYHVIFHDEQATRCMLPTGCSGNGRHAFSLDGQTWRYASRDAYTRNITFDNGSTLVANTRARPHVLLSSSSRSSTTATSDRQLLALSTGLKPTDESGYVWTVVQPLQGTEALERTADFAQV
jgi:hypothetical protein